MGGVSLADWPTRPRRSRTGSAASSSPRSSRSCMTRSRRSRCCRWIRCWRGRAPQGRGDLPAPRSAHRRLVPIQPRIPRRSRFSSALGHCVIVLDNQDAHAQSLPLGSGDSGRSASRDLNRRSGQIPTHRIPDSGHARTAWTTHLDAPVGSARGDCDHRVGSSFIRAQPRSSRLRRRVGSARCSCDHRLAGSR